MANRSIAILALFVVAAAAQRGVAQEVYRASWLIQDRERLQQQIARSIIERANDWLTRDDPNAATARLDDPLRVSVTVDYQPASGGLTTRLTELVLGTIVIDHDFGAFLDSTTISSLVRRDHYWRDEKVTVINEALSPLPAGIGDSAVEMIGTASARSFAAAEAPPRYRISLEQTSLRLSPRLSVWAGLGFDELALPGLLYGRLRAGVTYDGFRVWGEVPASFGAAGAPLFARGFDGGFGAGLSFEMESFGGAITWSDPLQDIDTAAPASGYLLGRSALFYGKLPISDAPVLGGYLRLKIGGAYLQSVRRGTAGEVAGARLDDHFLPMARVEYASDIESGGLMHSAAIEALGGNILLSYSQHFSDAFSARVTLSAHGLLGPREPYLPAYSLVISPVISLW